MRKAKFLLYSAKQGGSKGKYRWKLLASNGRIIACGGEGFVTKKRRSSSICALLKIIERQKYDIIEGE